VLSLLGRTAVRPYGVPAVDRIFRNRL
jgi:hypothetical protein